MTATRVAIAAALAAALAAAIASPAFIAHAQGNMEKCFGVAKAGKNDCQTDHSSCAALPRRTARKTPGSPFPGRLRQDRRRLARVGQG